MEKVRIGIEVSKDQGWPYLNFTDMEAFTKPSAEMERIFAELTPEELALLTRSQECLRGKSGFVERIKNATETPRTKEMYWTEKVLKDDTFRFLQKHARFFTGGDR